jgi:hypothetical protein
MLHAAWTLVPRGPPHPGRAQQRTRDSFRGCAPLGIVLPWALCSPRHCAPGSCEAPVRLTRDPDVLDTASVRHSGTGEDGIGSRVALALLRRQLDRDFLVIDEACAGPNQQRAHPLS